MFTPFFAAFRNWMNSIGVSPYVNSLFRDLRSGLVLLDVSITFCNLSALWRSLSCFFALPWTRLFGGWGEGDLSARRTLGRETSPAHPRSNIFSPQPHPHASPRTSVEFYDSLNLRGVRLAGGVVRRTVSEKKKKKNRGEFGKKEWKFSQYSPALFELKPGCLAL